MYTKHSGDSPSFSRSKWITIFSSTIGTPFESTGVPPEWNAPTVGHSCERTRGSPILTTVKSQTEFE